MACLHDASDIALRKHGCQEQGRAGSLLWHGQGYMLSIALAGPQKRSTPSVTGSWRRLAPEALVHKVSTHMQNLLALTWQQRRQLDAQRLRVLPDRLEG